ncbi:MAG: hypothetical protein ACJ8H8_29545 [Geminicoccaceae bacterium]
MVRRVVAEELVHAGTTATPSGPAEVSPVSLMRERWRQRRAR